MAGRLYNVHAKHTSNSDFNQTFMPCSGYFLCTAEQRAGYQISWVDLQREAKTVRESVGLPIVRGKLVCEFNFHFTVSITVVRSIETPQTTPIHPKLPQTSTKPPQTITAYILATSFNARIFFRTLTASSWAGGGGGARTPRVWHCIVLDHKK